MKTMRVKCRIWWPKQFFSCAQSDSMLLFGWFLPSCSDSLDIVVVPIFVSLELLIQSDIQEIVHCTNEKMPEFLQDKSSFCILGYCASDCSSNGPFQRVELEDDTTKTYRDVSPLNSHDSPEESNGRKICGCRLLNGPLEHYSQSSKGNWIQFFNDPFSHSCKGIRGIPKLHHIHWDDQLVPGCDVHVIIYESPTFGKHHYSLNSWGFSEPVKKHLKRPIWIDKLHQKQSLPDLDTVILAINCVTCAKKTFETFRGPKSSFHRFSSVFMLVSLACSLAVMFLASLSTFIYVILQFLHSCLTFCSQAAIYSSIEKIFRHTWKNIHIRSCQLLYWPVLLQDSGLRFQSNVEYAHKAALNKHAMWSSVAVDILLGNIMGFSLLYHIDAVCPWVLNLMHDITNDLLRSGCVWLMGVPAGFKLNTELAGVFGMISLNTIQIWSTLWFYLDSVFRYFIKGLALSGMVFGVTVPAALLIDMILLSSSHVTTLHWLISFLYSQQIKALAALWRLFRGRKWNPLRQRFDSYNYTVKQHVVGSLLFTPLLLLLPTTSVFYIFFTILNTAISFMCILIEVTISVLHATPYHEIFLWMVKSRRFPSGIWFEIVSGGNHSSNVGSLNEVSSSKKPNKRKMDQESSKDAQVVVSLLHSNFSSLGQIVLPHYRRVFGGVSMSSGATSAYRVLMGRRIPASLQTGLPSEMPWMFLTYKDYWSLCFNAMLSSTWNQDFNSCKR